MDTVEDLQPYFNLWLACIRRAIDDWNHTKDCIRASARCFLCEDPIVDTVLGEYGISRDFMLRKVREKTVCFRKGCEGV